MYNSFMNGYNPGYGTGYNQNNYGNYGRIYTKVYDAGLKESIFRVYQVINPNTQQPQIEGTQQVITAPQEQNPVTPMYDPKPDIKNIYSEIENIKKELGIKDAQQQKSIVPVKENEQ